MKSVEGETYRVSYDASSGTIAFSGKIRLLRWEAHEPIVQLMDDVASADLKEITLNLERLTFLNSPGIDALFRFAVRVGKHGNSHLIIRGSTKIPWQKKSLRNIELLVPGTKLEWA